MTYREEKDTMGTVRVPENAYYGAQTARAVENFPISGRTMPRSFLHALALIKKCAAPVNRELDGLDETIAGAIETSAGEVLEGKFDDQFPVDVFQTGSGTSTNMNMNEVIAGRANEILMGKRGGRSPVHPNDHVNRGQSSNDAAPSALHIAAMRGIFEGLIPALQTLHKTLSDKASAFADIKKIGRTHLQDAVPMTLGDEFSGYARQIALSIRRVSVLEERLSELALGGTAVGTGLNAAECFAEKIISRIAAHTKLPFKEAENHFEAQAARDAAVEASGAIKTVAVSLAKIANDIRWLASGPRCGIGEIRIPAVQPGSSIMPGKVNPVIPESVIQAAAQVMGNDTAIAMAGAGGNFEINVTIPLIARNLLESIDLLTASAAVLAEKCVAGIKADREACEGYVEKSLSLAANLIPEIGYDRAAEIAKKAHETGRTIRETARAENVLSEEDLNRRLTY